MEGHDIDNPSKPAPVATGLSREPISDLTILATPSAATPMQDAIPHLSFPTSPDAKTVHVAAAKTLLDSSEAITTPETKGRLVGFDDIDVKKLYPTPEDEETAKQAELGPLTRPEARAMMFSYSSDPRYKRAKLQVDMFEKKFVQKGDVAWEDQLKKAREELEKVIQTDLESFGENEHYAFIDNESKQAIGMIEFSQEEAIEGRRADGTSINQNPESILYGRFPDVLTKAGQIRVGVMKALEDRITHLFGFTQPDGKKGLPDRKTRIELRKSEGWPESDLKKAMDEFMERFPIDAWVEPTNIKSVAILQNTGFVPVDPENPRAVKAAHGVTDAFKNTIHHDLYTFDIDAFDRAWSAYEAAQQQSATSSSS